ncbi:MAG: integrase arm-type DNA-binding domain-containing protein, partial [Myxococcota bacterium]
MNNREKLTATSIRRYRDNHMMGERLRKWDSEVPGLFLRISPRGSAAYAVKIKRVDGSKAEATLGHVDKIALDQARRMAKAEFAKEAKGEPDLVTRRRQERLEAQQLKAQTLENLVDRYIEHLQKKGCGARYIKDTRLTFDTHIIPTLGKRPFREITRDDIETVVRETQKRAAKHRRSSP